MLGVHVSAGATAFLFAPLVALATRKGGPEHRRWGRIYFWAMFIVALSAIILSAYLPILFLALVAAFSFYAAFYAYRVLGRKNLGRGGRPGALDWAAASVTFPSRLCLASFGIFKPALVQGMGTVSVIFEILGMVLGAGRIRTFLLPPDDRMDWWYGAPVRHDRQLYRRLDCIQRRNAATHLRQFDLPVAVAFGYRSSKHHPDANLLSEEIRSTATGRDSELSRPRR